MAALARLVASTAMNRDFHLCITGGCRLCSSAAQWRSGPPPQFGRWREKNVIPDQARLLLLKSKAMTIIYLLSRVLGALVGVGLCLVVIFFSSAAAGLPIGVILGVAIGYLFSLVPPEVVRHGIKFSLRWSDTARLKERLRREHGLAPIIIEELVSRGEPVEQFRDYVESLLRSNSFIRRGCGKMIRRKRFPDMKP